MNTVPAGCPARLQPSSERKAGATDVHLGIELVGNPLTRDGSALVKVRVGSSFPLNGVLILLDEGVSSEEPRRATPSAAVRIVSAAADDLGVDLRIGRALANNV